MVAHRGTWRLRSTEELHAALEDAGVALSAMAASRHCGAFERDVARWQATLAAVGETLDAVTAAQRSWLHLEGVFSASDDIRRQLPAEAAAFDKVDAAFARAMRELKAAGSAVEATTARAPLAAFQAMGASLERVQRGLDAYLEAKRAAFPRLYFLSPADLLDVLAQARDPAAAQPHVRKLFQGALRLDLRPRDEAAAAAAAAPTAAAAAASTLPRRAAWEVVGVTSPDGAAALLARLGRWAAARKKGRAVSTRHRAKHHLSQLNKTTHTGEYLPLAAAVAADGRPEEWLARVEAALFASTKRAILRCLEDSKAAKKEQWVLAHPGQAVITASQILWTMEAERVLLATNAAGGGAAGGSGAAAAAAGGISAAAAAAADGGSDAAAAQRSALKALKRRWQALLARLTALARGPLDAASRAKAVALITLEVHARDVIDRLAKASGGAAPLGPGDFEWARQLRFYWERPAAAAAAEALQQAPRQQQQLAAGNGAAGGAAGGGDVVVRQVLSAFPYGYEYQGNSGRLVVTPLTDRAFVTLGVALSAGRGGNPLGPAGTGKTETVKDLGKALARFVVVFNCSDGVDATTTGRILSGLAQAGAWACLDEFNRVAVGVLSVAAQQIASLMTVR